MPESSEKNVPVAPQVQDNPQAQNAQKQNSEKILLTWQASSRPFKRRSKDFYVTLVTMASVVGLVIFLVEGFMPILLLISLLFLFYVLSTVEPETIEYQITSLGIRIADKTTEWEMMKQFWFTKRFGCELLVIEIFRIPGRIELVIGEGKKTEIKKELEKRLVHQEVPASSLDRIVQKISQIFPD